MRNELFLKLDITWHTQFWKPRLAWGRRCWWARGTESGPPIAETWRWLRTDLQHEQTVSLKDQNRTCWNSIVIDAQLHSHVSYIEHWLSLNMEVEVSVCCRVLMPLHIVPTIPLSTSSRAVLASWRRSLVRTSEAIPLPFAQRWSLMASWVPIIQG